MDKERIELPEVGWHEFVQPEIYHAWDLMSHGRLEILHRQTPAHLLYDLQQPKEPTDAQIQGTVTHVAVLQPKLFNKVYAPEPVVDKRTKAGKQELEEFHTANAHKKVIDAKVWQTAKDMADAAWSNADVATVLSALSAVEISGVFICPLTQLGCKFRPDGLSQELGCVVDYKTTMSASLADFQRSITNFGYHRQGSFYLEGCAALGLPNWEFLFIAQEKTGSYEAAVYELSQRAINLAAQELRALRAQYWECRSRNEWPGYKTGITVIDLPQWAYTQKEDRQ